MGNSIAVLHPAHCGALDLTTSVMFILQEGVYSKGEKCETLALMQVLQPATISSNVLDAHVQATFEHYESVRAHDECETRCGRERLELERCRRSIVAERLKEYDDNRALDWEQAVWNWHPLYHMCTVNPPLQHRLRPLPWVHSIDEAVKVRKLLSHERTSSMNMPREARLLRLHMLINGIFIKYVIASRHVAHTVRSQTVSCPAHLSHRLITVSLFPMQLG
jgi:hypothetical protein